MSRLIIAEKPSVALRIAMALGDSHPSSLYMNGVRYYEISQESSSIYIVPAAGHLFTIRQKSDKRTIPVFDVEWVASYKVNKKAYFTKKYLDVVYEVGKKCDFFINACDYDIEGTVIGTNIIKQIINNDPNSKLSDKSVGRMRFSTTTNRDLIEAYGKINEFDFNNFYAGEARHMLDWMWGINLSRALMKAIAATGIKKIMSIGRVQGPTLAILASRENEIKNFVSKPYWKIFATINGVVFENVLGGIFNKEDAENHLKKVEKGEFIVKETKKETKKMSPFPPFDLTSIQIEASKVFGIDPSKTLAIAQSLYEKSYISYPRTSSQKLPYSLNLPRIIREISKNEKYKEFADYLTANSRFRPVEGLKEDEAHPAIYPTGELPKKLTEEEGKIYDLVVRRFLSCFGEFAAIESSLVTLGCEGEMYEAKGNKVLERGWIDFYSYFKPKENILPEFEDDSAHKPEKVNMKEFKTEPPSRFNKSSLIALLEKKDLGTKATRTEIIDTLFRREYIKNSRIEVTELGMSVYNALSKYCGAILNEELTRKLEKDMENIMRGSEDEERVIGEGKNIIEDIIKEFVKNEKEISKELGEGLKGNERSKIIGTCNKCGGNLIIKRSNAGKLFVGCSNWPNCNNAYPLPGGAAIVPTGKVCQICKTPIVKVFRRGRRPFQMDLDPNCETKKDWGTPKSTSKTEEKSKVRKVKKETKKAKGAKATKRNSKKASAEKN